MHIVLHKIHTRRIFFLCAVLVAVLIFYFSSQPSAESTNTSNSVTYCIARSFIINFDKLTDYEKLKIIHYMSKIVRKSAHFLIYACLSFFISFGLFTYDGIKGKKAVLFSVIICALYAFTDELHQYFVPGRSCQLTDVMIDTFGALTGASIVFVITYIYKKYKSE